METMDAQCFGVFATVLASVIVGWLVGAVLHHLRETRAYREAHRDDQHEHPRRDTEPDACQGAADELAAADEPTSDGEPRIVAETPIVYEMRLPTYSSALGLPSPAEVAAALVDEWRGRERQS